MADVCRWCKGTKVILGFAWNTYPCECAQASAPDRLPDGVGLFGSVLEYTPGHLAVWRAVGVPSFDVAKRFCEWVAVRHPRMFTMRTTSDSRAYFDSLTPAERAELNERASGKCA